MRTVAHVSDLHFGVVDERVKEGLVTELLALRPSLTVISGDLTQRARASQFRAARTFLDRLPSPQIVVPGNHDVPLFDVVTRFANPLGNYCRHISRELNPSYEDADLLVCGLNTARSLTWKSGRISVAQRQLLQAHLERAAGRFKILVTHHPFIPTPMSPGAGIDLGRAADALTVIEDHAVDLLLAGHLHHGFAGDTRAHFASARRSIIAVQAGTAISRRVRHEPNAFNWITLEPRQITIEMKTWDGSRFATARTHRYALEGGAWIPQTSAA